MSTNNPFEKLNVKHEEEEDEQGAFEKVKGKVKNTPYGIEIKKRKTRPKEKAEEGNEEGFEEVKKGPKKRPTEDYAEDEQNQYKKGRRTKYERNEQNYEDIDLPHIDCCDPIYDWRFLGHELTWNSIRWTSLGILDCNSNFCGCCSSRYYHSLEEKNA